MEEWGIVLINKVDVLVLNQHLDVFLNFFIVKSLLDIFLELSSNIFRDSSKELGLDAVDDLEKWSLSPDEEKFSSTLDSAFLDVLV